jgi:hypothetical protein
VSIFLSSRAADAPLAAALIDGLRRVNVKVEHSPRNPKDGEDPRWGDWYKVGLPAALGRSHLFVAVIDRGWDSSTWMAIEADTATKTGLPMFFWNPEGVRVTARGMVPYLREEIPTTLDRAIELFARRGAG